MHSKLQHSSAGRCHVHLFVPINNTSFFFDFFLISVVEPCRVVNVQPLMIKHPTVDHAHPAMKNARSPFKKENHFPSLIFTNKILSWPLVHRPDKAMYHHPIWWFVLLGNKIQHSLSHKNIITNSVASLQIANLRTFSPHYNQLRK